MSGRKFLAELPEFHIAPTSMKMASLVDALVDAKRTVIHLPNPALEFHSLMLMMDEWSAFMHVYDDELAAGLVTLYDCTIPYEQKRRGYGGIHIKIPHPQLSLLAGTTPSSLIRFMPEGAWTEGLASRLVMVYSSERFVGDDFAQVRRDLPEEMIHDLKIIYSLQGEFQIDESFRHAVSAWRGGNEEPKPSHPKLTHYNTRRRAHVYKLAMVSSVDRGGGLRLTVEDFQKALGWLSEVEGVMSEIFEEGTTSVDARVIDEILDFIRRQGKPVPHHRLVLETSKRVPTYSVLKIIEIMRLSGRVKWSEDQHYLVND